MTDWATCKGSMRVSPIQERTTLTALCEVCNQEVAVERDHDASWINPDLRLSNHSAPVGRGEVSRPMQG